MASGQIWVRLVAERVLLTDARTGRRVERRDLCRAQRPERRWDQQCVGERVQDQRRDRERLDVERVRDRRRGRPEDAVRVQQSPPLQGWLHEHLAGPEANGGDADRARTQNVTTSDAVLLGVAMRRTAVLLGKVSALVDDFGHPATLHCGQRWSTRAASVWRRGTLDSCTTH
jgi:hypothetical protein